MHLGSRAPYNTSKVIQDNKNIDQTGFGQIDSSDKEEQTTTLDEDKKEQTKLDEDKEITFDVIQKDRELKRKALGDDIFRLMTSSKVKASNDRYEAPAKKAKEPSKSSKALNLGGIHRFKNK